VEWFLFWSAVISFSFVLCLAFLLLLPYLHRKALLQESLVSVVPVLKNDDKLELTVGRLMRQGRWNRRVRRLHILLVDCGSHPTDSETVKLCECLCKRWENVVYYCDFSSASALLKELLIAKKDEV
jgi:hypothetical protein